MTKVYDARPPALNVMFRPGVTLRLHMHWVQGGTLADRTFTSTLNGQALVTTVEGNTITVVVPDEVTENYASGARAEWVLAETLSGDKEPLIVGMWQASTAGASSRDRTVYVTQGTVEVAVTVVAGSGGSSGGGVGLIDSVNGQVGVVTLDATDVGAEPAGAVGTHAATVGSSAHMPAGGSPGDVPIKGTGSSATWGPINADPAGTAATAAANAVANHANDYGAGFHLPEGGTPGQIPTRGSGDAVGWTDPPVTSVNGEAGAVTLDAAGIPYTPTAPMVATNLQDAVDEAATLGGGGAVSSVNGEVGAVEVTAADVPFTPGGGVSGTTVQDAVISAAAAGHSILMWDDTASEWLLRVGDPATAPLRTWYGPVAPVLTTGPYSDQWAEDDIFVDTSTP